jgi:ABC-type molybdate transport system ATPase subunit
VSMELEEIMSLSDRILVMFEGRVVAEFEGGAVTGEELGLYMTGGGRTDSAADVADAVSDPQGGARV